MISRVLNSNGKHNFGVTVGSFQNVEEVIRSGNIIHVTPETHGQNPHIKINKEKEEDDIYVTGEFQSLNLERRVGNILIEQSTITHIYIYCKTGNVRLDRVTNQGSLQVDTMSGDVACNMLINKMGADIKTMSGDVHVFVSHFFGSLYVKSMSGDVNFATHVLFAEPCLVVIRTMSGDVHIPKELKIAKAQTMNGKIKVKLSSEGALINTMSGNIKSY